MADWTSLNYVVVDVEGNGQQPPELVELAAVPIVGGIIGDPSSWLVRPDQPIKYFVTRIHGLTNSDVADAPVEALKLAEELPDGLTPHRATYDALVTARLFVRLATLPDTCPLLCEEQAKSSSGSAPANVSWAASPTLVADRSHDRPRAVPTVP